MQRHLAVLAGTEMVPAGSTSCISGSSIAGTYQQHHHPELTCLYLWDPAQFIVHNHPAINSSIIHEDDKVFSKVRIYNKLSLFSGPSTSQPTVPNIPQHLAVLAGTEMVPATNTSPSSASATDSVGAGYHYVPSSTPLTVHEAHHQVALAPHSSSEVLPSSSGSRKGLLRNRRQVMVLYHP
jgi:hypothetical protein